MTLYGLNEITFAPPNDWPKEGAIDLSIHDLPHDSATIEWWYINCHVSTTEGKEISIFAAFFRSLEEEESKQKEYTHSLTWAIIDVENKKYYAESLLDPRTPEIALKKLEGNFSTSDPLLKNAMKEIFNKNKVPLPDKLLKKYPYVSLDTLSLDYDNNQFFKLQENVYQLNLYNQDNNAECELTIHLEKPPVRHGDNGVVRGTEWETMFYYFIPRCRIEGSLNIKGESLTVDSGQGWYDHEFGHKEHKNVITEDKQTEKKIAWNWIAIQLNNGYEISAYDLIDNDSNQNYGHWVVVIDPRGNQSSYSNFIFQPGELWTSSKTFENYPVQWSLEIPDIELNLSIKTEFSGQEFVTLLSSPAFWEGRISASGYFANQLVQGIGFVERSGFSNIDTIGDFLAEVGKSTRESLKELIPLKPTQSQLECLVSSRQYPHYINGLDSDQYSKALLEPIRTIVDRGGKAWRSYAVLACIDLVGGDSLPFLNWLALPELLHVGSLIIDDVQDASLVRRGGQSCHDIYGEAIAINAGSACYFLGETLLRTNDISDSNKLLIYQLYFDTLRAAHSGQAVDIYGFDHLMPDILQSGSGQVLEERILAVYRLKSAIPASSLAQIGVILGKGSSEHIEIFSMFFESLGIAFQIMDDVLNLRGFKNDLKSKGEDIVSGKITLPVAKAMGNICKNKREILWQILSSKPTEKHIIEKTIQILEDCSAIDKCIHQANGIVAKAWQKFDHLVPDSYTKIRLRAFSWYVLNRHY